MVFFIRLFILYILFGMEAKAQVNYDENDIPTYVLPQLLVSNDGTNINSSEEWRNIRRPEILEFLKNQVYGHFNDHRIIVKFHITDYDDGALGGRAIRKQVAISFANDIDTITANMLVYLPLSSSEPVPLIVGLNFFGNHTVHSDPSILISDSWVMNNEEFGIDDHVAPPSTRGVRAHRWPVSRIIERGYGLATIYYGDLDPDYDDGFKNGLHALQGALSKSDQKLNSSISAWAFGLSCAMDYFETDEDVDSDKIIVFGHSRLGKSSLWAGASDERFAMIISNNSGCGGAALSRRRYGETIKDINTRFPHWFASDFHQYNDNEDALPLDQHMLLATLAPRPIYVASALEDQWADPKGEFLSLFNAGPSYNLYGLKVFTNEMMPNVDDPIWAGKMAYHIRSGVHDVTLYDWEKYMDFADKHVRYSN